jgi:hypothetical protein
LDYFARSGQVGSRNIKTPQAKIVDGGQDKRAFAGVGRTRKTISPEYRGNPCQETANAPTTTYSALFEFKHSINSRKSLLKGIRVGSFAEFAENVHSLLRAHLRAGQRIRRVGFFETVEYPNYLLHELILLRARGKHRKRGKQPASGKPDGK